MVREYHSDEYNPQKIQTQLVIGFCHIQFDGAALVLCFLGLCITITFISFEAKKMLSEIFPPFINAF